MVPSRNSSDDVRVRRSGSLPDALAEHSFIEAAFNALPTQIAILNDEGDIVYTNEAWRSFGESNGIAEPSHTLGVNYLDVCRQSDDEDAETAGAGIEAVLHGSRFQFSFEYPCHGPAEQRWFTMRAIQFEYDGADFVLVLHLNITNRKLSELRVQEQNTELDTFNQVNSLIREVIDSLLTGVARSDIETTICEQLADSPLFRSAYVVDRALDDRGVAVQASAGLSEQSRDALANLANEDLSGSGLDTAITDNELHAVNHLSERSSLPESLVEIARSDEFESFLVVPIRYRNTVYGAFVVNALDPDAFSDRERTAFDVLGEAIGYAFNAIENKMILYADTVTELAFEVPTSDSHLAAVSAHTGCTVDLDGVVPAEDGALHCYVSVVGTSPATVLETISERDGIDPVRVVRDREEDFLLECTLHAGSPLVPLVEYGATVETARAENGRLQLSALVAAESDVRGIVESLLSVHPNASLLAKQQKERTVQSVRGFRGELDDRLTDRQRDILEGAYFAGYFKQPRESTGGDIASSFDISVPTFHQHLQASLNKLTALALDRE